MSKWTTQKLTVTALLIAIGILIPMIMPKVVIEPMSFTLASHVAIFLAVLISPEVAVAVVAGTTIGFAIAAFPIVIVLRAASHIVFAIVAALYVKKRPATLYNALGFQLFNVLVGLVHSLCEVIVVFVYYITLGGMASVAAGGGFRVLFLLVGVGTVIHSFVDFEIAYVIFRALGKVRAFASIFPYTNAEKVYGK